MPRIKSRATRAKVAIDPSRNGSSGFATMAHCLAAANIGLKLASPEDGWRHSTPRVDRGTRETACREQKAQQVGSERGSEKGSSLNSYLLRLKHTI